MSIRARFVGDYQGLTGDGSNFVASYVRTNTGDTANRTDVFADRVNGDAIATSGTVAGSAAQKTAAPAWTSSAEKRVAEHLSKIRERRSAESASYTTPRAHEALIALVCRSLAEKNNKKKSYIIERR